MAGNTVLSIERILNGGLGFAHGESGSMKKRGPSRGKNDPLRIAHKEFSSDSLLKSFNLLAECRLADFQPAGGPAKVEMLGDGEEVANLS
jgi:hypothetical protein